MPQATPPSRAAQAQRLRQMARTVRVFADVFGERRADADACEAGASALDLLPRVRRALERLREVAAPSEGKCACALPQRCPACEADGLLVELAVMLGGR